MYAWVSSFSNRVTGTLRNCRWSIVLLGAASALSLAAADCVPPVSGLVGWWPGDGSATNLLGANNGTLASGATATGVGMVGQAFRFDGVNSYVSVPDNAVLKPTNLTIEAWVQFSALDSSGTASAGQQYIVFKQNTRSSYFEGYYLGKERTGSTDHFSFGVTPASGVGASVDSTTQISAGVWYHVAAVRGPSTIQLYVNGQLQGQAAANFAQNYGTTPLYFGSSGVPSWDRRLAGLLDEVSLYNRALTSNEIAAIYLAGAAGKCKSASALSITTQPQSQSVVIGSNATFTVAATGNAPIGYQWTFNDAPIGGATGTALTLTGVQATDAGPYRVIVTNATASVTSSVANLTVLIPPSINGQPQSATNVAGTTANFSASALGTAPLSYQWRQNGTNLTNGARITGATTPNLSIANVQASDAGNYTLFVSNAAGNATSDPATLTVNGPPNISVQPVGRTVPVGTNVSISVTASGTLPLSYQWRKGGSVLGGATTSVISFPSVQAGDAGDYDVVITNVVSSVTSSVATLTVLTPPGITLNPGSSTNAAGTSVTFIAGASGSAPLSYRWTQNGTPLNNGGRITGATSTSLNITGLISSDAGSYVMWVTNAVGVASSTAATLVVNTPPSITQQPASVTAIVGSNATFNVIAAGTAPLSYQWRKGGTNISNATATSLTLTGVQTNDAGNYQVVVGNSIGSITSAVAVLTVSLPVNCLPATAGIIAWWPGDGSAIDVIGANNGTLVGGATAAGLGKVGAAFTFDGVNNSVSIPDSPVLRPANLTIEAWVKFNSLDSSGNAPAGQQYIVFKQNTRNSFFEGFYLGKERNGNTDTFTFGVSSATGANASVNSTTTVAVGVWYHVAAVRGASTIQIYVNGQMQGQANVNFAQDYGNFPLYFGTSGQTFWDRKLNGVLDEVTLYNRALTAAEISAIYNIDSAGKCKAPTAPTIVTQPTTKTYVSGGSTTFSVVAAGSTPLGYRWTRDGFNIVDDARVFGSTTATLSITQEQPSDIANYQVTVTNAVGSAVSAVASLNTGAPPANDNFSAAVAISGSSGSVTGNNANATHQSGEPNHAGNPGPSSVWYNWTAPSTSPVTIDTTLSAFDTLLAVYTGNAVGSLTPIASNNNISTNNSRSRLTFTPVAGTVYHIAVDGANGANGNITMRWIQASVPLPDLLIFGNAVNPYITTVTFSANSCAVVEGLVAAGTRRLIRFDTQTANQGGADLVFGNPANNPLFVYANCHAHYHFQNYMSYRLRNSVGQLAAVGLKVGFCVLDVFRWDSSAPNNMKYTCNNQGIQKGWGDLYDSTLDGQWIDITGLPDGNYTIEMEANPMGIIQESNYGNNITLVPITIGNSSAPPANDNLASAQMLLGTSPSVSGTTANATKQAGEPNHAGNAGGSSVWYDWTAPSTKQVTIDTVGSSINTLLGVYTGTQVNALTLVANNDDITPGSVLQSRVTFNAVANTTYHIAVDGFNGASGPIVVTVNQTVANDAFNACIFTGGPQGTLTGSTGGATKEAGEPNHGGDAGGHSIWYCWTAPVTGTATFDTIGSTFNTLLGVYTGSAVGGLTLVAGNDDIGGGTNQSRVSFNAVGLTMYHIAIDGFGGDSGNTRLNWSLLTGAPSSLINNLDNPYAVQTISDSRAVLTFNLIAEGMCQISIAGQPQQKYRIERSCDLRNWVPLATTVADFDGQAWFTDKAAKHLTGSGDTICGNGQVVGVAVSATEARFYRAVEVP